MPKRLPLIEWLDLCGRDERLSFTKEITVAVLACGTFGKLNTVLGVAILACSHGTKAFMTFLGRSSFSAAVTEAHTVTETIQVVRNEVLGHQDTP